MTLFIYNPNTSDIGDVTNEDATNIYNLLKQKGKDQTNVFVENGYKLKHVIQVYEEAKRIESEVNTIMVGDPQPETQEALVGQISSTMLTVATVVDDIRKFSDGNPDEAPVWATYKASFSTEEA